MTNTSKTQTKTGEGLFIEGLQKHESSMTGLMVQGKSTTVAAAIAVLQARIGAITAAQSARVAWIDAVQQQDKELASTDEYVDSLVTVVRGMFAGSPSSLADFGLTPRKAFTLTAEEKALAVDKRAATRKARNTLGKKQKADIHGDVTSQTATTSSPAPTVTPLTSGTAAGTAGTGTPHT